MIKESILVALVSSGTFHLLLGQLQLCSEAFSCFLFILTGILVPLIRLFSAPESGLPNPESRCDISRAADYLECIGPIRYLMSTNERRPPGRRSSLQTP